MFVVLEIIHFSLTEICRIGVTTKYGIIVNNAYTELFQLNFSRRTLRPTHFVAQIISGRGFLSGSNSAVPNSCAPFRAAQKDLSIRNRANEVRTQSKIINQNREVSMAETRDWQEMKSMSARLLKERTGEDVDTWNRRIEKEQPKDEQHLRAWLAEQGVTGYAQSLLVMERFGYPDFLLASADELIGGQYADRPQLRPILDAILGAAAGLGPVTIQARKTYVSLVSPRRTFARVQPTTKDRVDLGLRLEGIQPGGRPEHRRSTDHAADQPHDRK
jgi:hypothetical protein